MSSYHHFFSPPFRITIPPELATEATLLTYLGMSGKELKKIWWYRGGMYRQFEVTKGKGKTRIISAPDGRLKFLQRKIAVLLDQMYRVRHPVHGFVAGRSVKTNALAHLHKRFVLNIDLKDFFPSITENRVSGMLESLGLDDRIASILTRLCCNDGHLPQGAPSSPVLSNMICFRLDKQLMAHAKAARCIYTRYADDITYSSPQPLTALFEGPVPPAGHFPPDLLTPALRQVLSDNGFMINPDKAHYADRHSRRMVTGLKVNELLNVDRRFVRNIRAALHSVERLGEKDAQQVYKDKYGGGTSIAAHLAGKITWLRHIRGQTDPVFRSIALRFNKCFPAQKLKLDPTPVEVRDRALWVVEHQIGKWFQGTAFFLKGVGLVTAAHCVYEAEGKVIEVFHPTKPANKFRVTILKMDEHRDLALLKHEIPTTEFFEFKQSTAIVAVGTQLIALGYPSYRVGDKTNVRPGVVSSMPVAHGVQFIEVTQKLAQGMSGGPLVDSETAVVGITHKGGPDEGRDLSIHITMLDDWLKEA